MLKIFLKMTVQFDKTDCNKKKKFNKTKKYSLGDCGISVFP
jgi:hypothetical protein